MYARICNVYLIIGYCFFFSVILIISARDNDILTSIALYIDSPNIPFHRSQRGARLY